MCFPFIKPASIPSLTVELPAYNAALLNVTDECDDLQWWRAHATLFPAWAATARAILTIAPSSAAVERVFSYMNAYITDRQQSLLIDSCEAMLMLQINSRSSKM